jgi:hypothetical protein
MSQKEMRFPEELATDVKPSQFYVIENSDIATEADLNRLIELMFLFPERDFFLYGLKEQGANHLVLSAEHHGVLRIERWETQYYPHPKYKRDWIRIDKPNPIWDWEKIVRETSPEFIRFTLKLTERWRRKTELQEALSESKKPEDKSPLVLKPSFYGVGIDLPKAWRWLKEKWKK